MFSMKEFGQRVSNLRKVRNLTQDELAYRVNVNKGHISRIERGTVACSLELLIDLFKMIPYHKKAETVNRCDHGIVNQCRLSAQMRVLGIFFTFCLNGSPDTLPHLRRRCLRKV